MKLKQRLHNADYFVSDGVNHVISHSLYTRDPDGYSIELTIDQPQQDWKDNPNAFKQDYSMKTL